jgi:cytochrome c553
MTFLRSALATSVLVAAIAHADDAKLEIAVQRAVHVCAACHGEGGRNPNGANPSLAGQMPLYVIAQLKDFRSQTRAESDVQAYMWGVSALLDDAMIEGLAEYFASQMPSPGKPGDSKLIAEGRKIFQDGIAARGVRACAGCHGANAEGHRCFRVWRDRMPTTCSGSCRCSVRDYGLTVS